jgi:hypothetical protein
MLDATTSPAPCRAFCCCDCIQPPGLRARRAALPGEFFTRLHGFVISALQAALEKR